MKKTKYTVKPTTQFKKDYKLAMKRGLKINLLEDVIAALAMGEFSVWRLCLFILFSPCFPSPIQVSTRQQTQN